jgi:hypothetical protein
MAAPGVLASKVNDWPAARSIETISSSALRACRTETCIAFFAVNVVVSWILQHAVRLCAPDHEL